MKCLIKLAEIVQLALLSFRTHECGKMRSVHVSNFCSFIRAVISNSKRELESILFSKVVLRTRMKQKKTYLTVKAFAMIHFPSRGYHISLAVGCQKDAQLVFGHHYSLESSIVFQHIT